MTEQFRDEVSIDEIDEVETPTPEPKDDAPASSQQELLDRAERLSEALRISERARMEMMQHGSPAPKPEEQPKELTREELAELMREDPLAALDYIDQKQRRDLEAHLSQRLAPLASGALSTMENAAKQKYATEFELFGDQIEELKKQVDPQILANPETWDQMVSYVRGLPQNFDTILEHRMKAQARQAVDRESGFTPRGNSRPAKVSSPTQLDATTLEICKTLGITPEEYIKWS